MLLTFDDFDSRLPSARLWKAFAPPEHMNPTGSSWRTPSGNPAFGFFDDFFTLPTTTLISPYLKLASAGCTVEQIVDTATEKGIVQLAIDGNAANDEAVLQWGRGIGAPFAFNVAKDLVFECRFAVSAITAAKWSIAVGLGNADSTDGLGITDKLFADTTGALATTASFVGFQHLQAEGAAWDGSYKAASQTAQDGSTKTKLDSLHTMVADTYVKLGFRYRANPKTVEFYVNGAMPGGTITPARLTAAEVAAATFPASTVPMAPVIGIKDIAGNAALNLKMDWWGAAQLL
jgi:hypothetical protein